jgi:hypothetical protein
MSREGGLPRVYIRTLADVGVLVPVAQLDGLVDTSGGTRGNGSTEATYEPPLAKGQPIAVFFSPLAV